MTLKEKIGQLFVLGFHGTTVSADFARVLSFYKPGGVILFARNLDDPAQAATLANELQSYASETPLWISIDHEGGTVFRLPNGLTPLPTNGELGRRNSEELVASVASVGARELRAIGVNVNYVPVLDLNTNPRNPIIGERSFGIDPDLVSRLGWATVNAYCQHGILPCGKHFPGHGDTDTDSHCELPVVSLAAEQLRARECRPFHALIAKGIPAIMTAHVQYPHLDSRYPASLSQAIQTGLLREELQFNGLISAMTSKCRRSLTTPTFRVPPSLRWKRERITCLSVTTKRDRWLPWIPSIRQFAMDVLRNPALMNPLIGLCSAKRAMPFRMFGPTPQR